MSQPRIGTIYILPPNALAEKYRGARCTLAGRPATIGGGVISDCPGAKIYQDGPHAPEGSGPHASGGVDAYASWEHVAEVMEKRDGKFDFCRFQQLLPGGKSNGKFYVKEECPCQPRNRKPN